jgi:hypothetical protein
MTSRGERRHFETAKVSVPALYHDMASFYQISAKKIKYLLASRICLTLVCVSIEIMQVQH